MLTVIVKTTKNRKFERIPSVNGQRTADQEIHESIASPEKK